MELQEFIVETMNQLVAGVKGAQSQAIHHGAAVNPKINIAHIANQKLSTPFDTENGTLIQNVEFDVAVTVQSGKEAKGTAGIRVWGVGVGGEGRSESLNSTVSRIRFSLPVCFPPVDVQSHSRS